jgi:hypothetical protein
MSKKEIIYVIAFILGLIILLILLPSCKEVEEGVYVTDENNPIVAFGRENPWNTILIGIGFSIAFIVFLLFIALIWKIFNKLIVKYGSGIAMSFFAVVIIFFFTIGIALAAFFNMVFAPMLVLIPCVIFMGLAITGNQ